MYFNKVKWIDQMKRSSRYDRYIHLCYAISRLRLNFSAVPVFEVSLFPKREQIDQILLFLSNFLQASHNIEISMNWVTMTCWLRDQIIHHIAFNLSNLFSAVPTSIDCSSSVVLKQFNVNCLPHIHQFYNIWKGQWGFGMLCIEYKFVLLLNF